MESPPENQGFPAWFSSKTPQMPSKTNSYFKMSHGGSIFCWNKVHGVGSIICCARNYTTSARCCSLRVGLNIPSNSLPFYKILGRFLKGPCPKVDFPKNRRVVKNEISCVLWPWSKPQYGLKTTPWMFWNIKRSHLIEIYGKMGENVVFAASV